MPCSEKIYIPFFQIIDFTHCCLIKYILRRFDVKIWQLIWGEQKISYVILSFILFLIQCFPAEFTRFFCFYQRRQSSIAQLSTIVTILYDNTFLYTTKIINIYFLTIENYTNTYPYHFNIYSNTINIRLEKQYELNVSSF